MTLLLIVALAAGTAANATSAPQPESLKLIAYYDIGAERYREIEVACSNRSEALVYKREQQREWCVGGPGIGDCFKDNISAAKRACANSVNTGVAND
jgi:hypothetical protein